MGFRERLIEAMQNKGISAAELSRRSGIGEGAISQYKSGAYKASQINLEKLAIALQVPIDWLMGSPEDVVTANNVPAITDNTVKIPILGEIAAGYDRCAVEDWDNGSIEIPRSYLRGRPEKDYFMLRVHGDSMYPLYIDGDIVLVLKQATLNRSGDIGVLVINDDEATLKKVEYVVGEDWMKVIPINPQYSPVMVQGEALEHCRVLGIPRMVIREIKE